MPDNTDDDYMDDYTVDHMSPPLGAVLDAKLYAETAEAMASAGPNPAVLQIQGAWRRAVTAGTLYYNQADDEKEFIKLEGSRLIKSAVQITPSGILMPQLQRTGICDGCSHRKGTWRSWISRFVRAGDVPTPKEPTFLAPYLMGRSSLRGDSGAYPSYTVRGLRDLGLLCVDAPGTVNLRAMTLEEQENLCVSMRDNPKLQQSWLEAMKPLALPVFMPPTMDFVADLLASFYSVTVGMSSQITPPIPGGNGISSWYNLGGGHETCLCGWFTWKGRLAFIKDESWGWFPADKWPEKRITVQTDAGPKKLYEGQGACWASDLWTYRPEAWGIGYPTGF